VTTAVINKQLATASTKELVVAKPVATVPNNGPITQSKYFQALSDIVRRRCAPPSPQLSMMESAQEVLDDKPLTKIEHAFEIFNDDIGKLL
jgi:hypothetical protein